MIAAPWYLLAIGTILVILGYVTAGLTGSRGRGTPMIDHRMSDEEIAHNLNRQESLSIPELVTFLGYFLVFVSIVWRLVRYVV